MSTAAASRAPVSRETARAAQARREAALDAQKRSFLRKVSHELRTPLNSILGFSEILACELYGPLGDPQYKQYAQIIRGSGEKLLRLVNQLLEIARLEGGDLDFDLAPERLAHALDDVLAGLRPKIAARGLRLAMSGCDDAVVLADARGLRTVLRALLQNAAAFSPAGGEVRISARPLRERLEILVGSDGEGVQPAELSRLTQAFEQGEDALIGHGAGAGLGLAICQLTCRAMGGRLKLASKPGAGFEARVVLPGP